MSDYHLFREKTEMSNDVVKRVATIMGNYVSSRPEATAKSLREYWLEFEPNRGIELIKAEQREQSEAAGIPIPRLKAIGKEIARMARKDVAQFIPLAQLLWNQYGREGRVVALIVAGAMELVEPERLVSLLLDMCKDCVSWEDANRLAMDALEPIVRKYPDRWLEEIATWLHDENKWVRRASIITIGRLPLKHPSRTGQCLELTKRLLCDTDTDVKKATSFAIRLCAKADPKLVCVFLEKQIPASDPAAVWVLCDVVKKADRKSKPIFAPFLPRYEKWSQAPDISSKD